MPTVPEGGGGGGGGSGALRAFAVLLPTGLLSKDVDGLAPCRLGVGMDVTIDDGAGIADDFIVAVVLDEAEFERAGEGWR